MEKIIKKFVNPSLSVKRNNLLNDYRKIDKFTDLTLKSTDGKTMRVHKNILSASCGYFEAMFNSDLVETRQELIQLVDDLTIADLEILIEYIYTGKTEISLENAKNIFIKAQYIQLVELQEFCSEFIIENMKIENCLDYWRNSIKYSNIKLKDACFNFIKLNRKNFLEKNIMDLTSEELKLIMSAQVILPNDQEALCKIVAKWVKADFESRNLHLMELIDYLDFMEMSDEFIEIEVMSDEVLQNNREFGKKMTKITFQKLRDLKKTLNLKSEGKENSSNKNALKNIYLVSNGGIYKVDWSELKWEKEFNFEVEQYFGTVSIKDDIFISGGCKNKTEITSNFKSWNVSSRKINELPKMIEKRCKHKLIDFKGKIYCCGGYDNKGSTEIFDFGNLEWIKGPTMNEISNNFGLVTSDDSIYAFGGWTDNNLPTKIVEQFDSREGEWRIISKDAPELFHATILSNKSVYCFSSNFGGRKFDLRTNTWTDSLAKVFEKKEGLKYYAFCCDIVEFNDEIFGVFQTDDNKTWGTFKFDTNSNKWANLNITLNLNEYDDINLCVISEP